MRATLLPLGILLTLSCKGKDDPAETGNVGGVVDDSGPGTDDSATNVLDDSGTGTDDSGDTDTPFVNTDPLCEITNPLDGDAAGQGEKVTFSATATDGESTPEELIVTFESDLNGELAKLSPNAKGVAEFTTDTLSDGTHNITLNVTDPHKGTCSAAILFSIGDPPTAEILTPLDDDVFGSGSSVEFTALVSDLQDLPTDLEILWESDVDGELDTAAADKKGYATFYADWLTPGLHTLTLTVTDLDGTFAQDTVEFSINVPPTQPTVSIVPDPAYTTNGLSYTIDVASTDAEKDPITYRAEWYKDGKYYSADTTISSGVTAKDEVWAVRVIPSDGYSEGLSGEATITISNTAPSIDGVSISPDPALTSDDLECAYTGFADDDGDSDASSFAWELNGKPMSETTETLSAGSFVGGDQVTCIVTPNDGTDNGTSMSATITITNTPPVLDSVSLEPDPAGEQDTLTCTPGTTTDADGTTSFTYSTTWSVNSKTIGVTTDTLDGTYFDKGDTVYCEVTPNDGDDDGDTVRSDSITVQNTAPTVDTLTIDPDPAFDGDTLTCNVTGVDVDGDTVSFNYSWSVNGTDTGITSNTLSGGNFAKDDEVECTVIPTDTEDDGDPVTASLTISNTPPEVESISLGPDPAYEGDTLLCTVSGTDVDGDTVFWSYDWLVNGSSVGLNDESLDSSYFNKDDDIECVATPLDGDDEGAPATSNTVTIQNTQPTVDSVSLSPDPATEIDTLTCSATGSDVDGDTVTFTYTWTVNGSGVGGSGANLDGADFDKGDDVYCTATPNDGDDDGTSADSNTVTISNTAPQVDSIAISPTTAYETTTLSCDVSTSDVDGDSVSVSYSWEVNGSDVGVSSSTLDGADFDKNDTVTCSATPDDGEDSGASDTSAGVTILNSQPTATNVGIDPSPAYTVDDLECTYTFTDVDGDSDNSSFTWTINGGSSSETGNILDSSEFVKDDLVICQVTPNDGTENGIGGTAGITVSNSPPVLADVALTPDPAYEPNTFTCTPGATTDDDGDSGFTYTYSWTVDGSDVGVSTQTLSGTYFDRDEDVYCTATPNDGEDDGAAVDSNTVTVTNSTPEITSISISPNPAFEGDFLSCDVSTNDDDGDSVSLTFSWYINGFATGATTQTLSSGFFDRDNSVVCEATPNDGTIAGTTQQSAALVVSNTPPEVNSVSVTPTTAYEDDTLTCSASTNDEDGDGVSIIYAWEVNGSTVGGATTSTLDGADFDKDDDVECVVTPDDGTDTGSPATSNTVTISNTAPTQPTADIDPGSPNSSDDLWCEVVTGSTDLDGDSITYSFDWYLDGALWTGATANTVWTGDTIPSSQTITGDEWDCVATPNDGDTDGPSDSSSTVTITPSTQVYYINGGDLINQTSWCGGDDWESDGTNDWGITWTDTVGTTPVSITVELNWGVDCDGDGSHDTWLNGTYSGTHSESSASGCTCSPTETENTWVLTDVSGHNNGGLNTFMIESSTWEGISQNGSWSNAFARVTVDY